MHANPIHPLPGSLAQKDLAQFQALTADAVAGTDTSTLLVDLAAHFNIPQLVLRRFSDSPPPFKHAVVAPLVYGSRYLGDLYAETLDETDRLELAQRMESFAPLFALLMAGETSLLPSGQGELSWLKDLNEERERLEAVLESTNDALLLLDTNERVVLATLQFETFTGISRYAIMGQPVSLLVEQINQSPGLPRMANLLRALAGNRIDSLGGEFEIDAPQRRVLVWYSVPVYIQSGTLLGRIVAFRDATRERELDRMKSEFIALVSHELRTPLTSVKGFSDLILEGNVDQLDENQREYMRIIAVNTDRLIELLNDILDVTRIDSDRIELKPSLCAIDTVIIQVLHVLEPLLATRDHELNVDIEPNLPPVWGDETRITQIVQHLLSNAIKYTLEPGTITIQARFVQHIDDLSDDPPTPPILPCVLVSVQDTGVGIAPEDQKHLFDRFFRADTPATRRVGGTGLGLMLVKSFVDMQGGEIWFESEIEVGSKFFFTVPVIAENRLENL